MKTLLELLAEAEAKLSQEEARLQVALGTLNAAKARLKEVAGTDDIGKAEKLLASLEERRSSLESEAEQLLNEVRAILGG